MAGKGKGDIVVKGNVFNSFLEFFIIFELIFSDLVLAKGLYSPFFPVTCLCALFLLSTPI